MQGKLKWILIINLLLTGFHVSCEELPYQAFSRLKNYTSVKLSPDGSKLAFIQNIQDAGMAVLCSYDLATKETLYLVQSDNEKVLINWFNWANEETILVGVRYAGNRNSTDTVETRLFAIDVKPEREEARLLIKPKSSTFMRKHFSQFQDRVIDLLPEDPQHILVALDLDKPVMPSVYKLNIYTKKKSRIEKGKKLIRSWMTDRQHTLRLGLSIDYKTGETKTFIRENADSDWQSYFEYNAFTDPPIYAVGFALDPNILYFKKYKDDKLSLFKLNLKTKEQQVVFHNPDYDYLGNLVYSKKTKDVVGIGFISDEDNRLFWDDSRNALQQSLDKSLPDTHNFLVSFDTSENKYVLLTINDEIPGTYYIGDRSKNTLTYLFQHYPELDSKELSEHQIVKYTARDGLEIEGYLTLPKKTEGPMATIIFPHGGPTARVTGGFDYWTSFFANQGYVVFRPNFRGSFGYGYDFAYSNLRRWGLEMQDDLEDAVHYLVDKGIADKERVCIVGGSYGGYAAMMGIAKTPDIYKCAVSFAGVSNLEKLFKNSKRYLNKEYVKNRIGGDSEDLQSRSPHYRVKDITSPLLLIHGENDRVVDAEHSRMMAEEMQDEGKTVEYIELENGTHYLSIQRNRHKTFAAMEKFLKTHLN